MQVCAAKPCLGDSVYSRALALPTWRRRLSPHLGQTADVPPDDLCDLVRNRAQSHAFLVHHSATMGHARPRGEELQEAPGAAPQKQLKPPRRLAAQLPVLLALTVPAPPEDARSTTQASRAEQ